MAEKRGEGFGSNWVSSGDLSGSQFKPVVMLANNVVAQGNATLPIAGVLQNKPKNAEHASVVGFGYTKLYIAGSLGQGAEWGVGASNVGAVLATSGSFCGGYVLHACDSGEIAEAYVSIYRKQAI